MSKKWHNLNSSSSSNNSNQNDLVIDYFFEPSTQSMPVPINADFPIGTFSIDDDFSTMSTVRNVAHSVENGMLMSSPPSHLSSSLPSDNSGYDSNAGNQGARETGIIEKLLHSYGFIQCCDRQARLFFHFSQFSGNIEHLKIGDPVEFEMTYDRRTGKPIASFVSKISPEAVMREERVTGSVTTEIYIGINGDVQQGRISYENRGECFFLPFTKDDVEGNVCLTIGDKVSFQIATNNKGNLGARNIRLENATHPIKYRGIVCSLKDNFGFIERADVVKEIFFHISETQHDILPGDHVEFIIQTRAGKEIACNLEKLPLGTVVLEDISSELMKGQLLKPIDRKELQTMIPNGLTVSNSENYMGRIRYRACDHSEKEILFGYKDQIGDFTLRHGDWVRFYITTDRRDQLQRATMIELMPESFNMSGEKREQGTVDKICDCFGFLRCTDRENRVFFHFNELLEPNFGEPKIGDEFEFTVLSDSSNKQQKFNAIRLLKLEPGTAKFEILLFTQINGVITKDIFHNTFFNDDDFGDLLNSPKNPLVYNPFDQINLYSGLITYMGDNCVKNTIKYYLKDCDSVNSLPTLGDKVVFNISQVKATKEFIATSVQVIETLENIGVRDGSENGLCLDQYLVPECNSDVQIEPVGDTENNTGRKEYQIGFITQTFKENFGFIETLDQKDEVFFHYSHFDGDISKIKCGEAVEYVLSENTKNLVNDRGFTASCVRLVDSDSIKKPEVDPKVYKGIVQRALRHFNSDQNEYSGLIELLDALPMNTSGDQLPDTDEIPSSPVDKGSGVFYHYGMMSLINKADIIQVNNHVNFQLDSENRVCNLALVKKWFKSKVDAIKGDFGFLTFEVADGRKLFFHMSEVKDGAELKVGDLVKFYIVKSIRTGKCSAHNIIKLEVKNKKERPERLINRLRNVSMSESGPKLTIIRQPKGPDNDSKGFSPTFRSMHFPREVPE